MQMQLQPNGDVCPCCWNQETVVGNVRGHGLLEIWNSSKMQALRREFLKGKTKTCHRQMKQMGCHKASWRPPRKEDPIELTARQVRPPRRIDFRINGRCNLQCVMCSVWEAPNGVYDQSDFWQRGPTDIFPFLKEIDMVNGEPFIQKDTYRLIDQVVAVNDQCQWAFYTNGNYDFSPRLRGALDQIKIRWIQVSLDSLNEEVYRSLRRRGSLSRALATLEEFLRYGQVKNFEVRVSMAIQQQNWREIPEFIQFAAEKNLTLHLQFVADPAQVSLLTLPASERSQVLQFLRQVSERFGPHPVRWLIPPLEDSLLD